jgi:predicted homoserine dehydrogenase-like protein
MSLRQLLEERAAAGNPVRVGLVGAGQMGMGLINQMELMPGMHAVAVADIVLDRVRASYQEAGVPDGQIVEVSDVDAAGGAIAEGKRVALQDATMLTQIPTLDVIVEATGIPEIGAKVAWDAILHRKHMVQMNVETDATVGYVLRRMAEAAGVVYTLTIGDEPGAAMELYNFAHALGYEIVCVGKGKNNPLNRTATPESLAEEAARKDMNPKMLAGFVDGTKTMVEMTSLGNGIGYGPDVRGMHGPTATPKTLKTLFVPESEGGVLESTHVVDFALGTDVSPGVFLIFTTDQPKIAKDLAYLSMGPGPYYSLYRPYHLTSLETPISIARAVLKGETTLATDRPPVAETVALAKRDLQAGEQLDTIGGFTMYGLIEKADVARAENLVPIGLAQGATMVNDVASHTPITYDDVELDESLTIFHLRQLQDRMIEQEQGA